MMSSTKRKKQKKSKSSVAVEHLPSVEKAVQEYRVIEDGAYAYHLQNEEIENHYANNVNQRKIVQNDIKKAKILQDEEDKRAKIWTIDQQEEIASLDSHLAVAIQQELTEAEKREEEEAQQLEIGDRELGLLLYEQERRRAAQHGPRSLEEDRKLAERLQSLTLRKQTKKEEDRMRDFTDEELAARLQQEEELETNRCSNHQTAQEQQDAELAKYIHQKDVEKAEAIYGERRAKSKKSKSKRGVTEPLYYDDNFNAAPPPYSPADKNKSESRPARPPPPQNTHRHHRDTEIKRPVTDKDAVTPSRYNGDLPSYRRRDDEHLPKYSPRRRGSDDRLENGDSFDHTSNGHHRHGQPHESHRNEPLRYEDPLDNFRVSKKSSKSKGSRHK